MLTGRQYVLIITGIVAISLGIAGGLMYPLAGEGILSIILYEILIAVGIIACLLLIDKRGLEDS